MRMLQRITPSSLLILLLVAGLIGSVTYVLQLHPDREASTNQAGPEASPYAADRASSLSSQPADSDAQAIHLEELSRLVLPFLDGSPARVYQSSYPALRGYIARLDPELALRLLAILSETHEESALIVAPLILDLVRSDLDLLNAWFAAIPDWNNPPLATTSDRVQFGSIAGSPHRVFEQGMVALGVLDPYLALDRFLMPGDKTWINNSTSGHSLLGIWARHDPVRILDVLKSTLDPVAYRRAEETLVRAWVISGSVDGLVHAARMQETNGQTDEQNASTLGSLAYLALSGGASPDDIIRAASQMPPAAAEQVLMIGYVGLAETDPELAEQRLEEVPRLAVTEVVVRIATEYARDDIAGALEWARNQGIPDAETAVILVLADTDPSAALDLALTTSDSAVIDSITVALELLIDQSPDAFPATATRLNAMNLTPDQYEHAMSVLTRNWLSQPDSTAQTFDWLLSHGSGLPPSVYETAAFESRGDLPLVTEMFSRLPANAREAWADGIARQIRLRLDAEQAAALLASLSGAAFDRATASVARSVVELTPAPFWSESRNQLIDSGERWINNVPDLLVRNALLSQYHELRNSN